MKVAIVDAYSTGNQICQRLAARGVPSFHVQSAASIPNLLEKSYRREDFATNFVFDNNWDELIQQVAAEQPTHIVGGSEIGVLFADKLAHALNLPCNDFALSDARRNKFLMLEAVRAAGFEAAWQIKENSLPALLAQLKDKQFPVVVKPLSSSSGDGFHACHNLDEVCRAYDNILGKANILGETNNYVLCQPFLTGTEFVINTVSHDGHHYVTDVWEMQHRHTAEISMIIDSMTLLPREHPNWQLLVEYTRNILDAIGVRVGAAHTEVMLTAGGPSLIESNVRLMGGNIDPCFKEALGEYDQVDALVDSIVDPARLKQKLENGYALATYIAEVDFVFYQGGTLRSFIKEQEVRQLANFNRFSKMPAIGSKVNRTSSTTNVEGLLYLIGNNYDQVVADRNLVVQWQRNNQLFEIES